MPHLISDVQIDVPGYDRLSLHPATRFIATMNYGYAGTKELNEALVSRFAVIRMPMISKESLVKLIKEHYPAIREAGANELAEVFLELHTKCKNGEISSKALDLRASHRFNWYDGKGLKYIYSSGYGYNKQEL